MTKTKLSGRSPDKRIAIYVTSVYMVRFFLIPHLNELSKKYDVTLILNNDAPEILASLNIPVRIIDIPIERKISLIRDFKVLIKTILLFKKEKFDLVHTMTPKAGLIGILASFITRVPKRVHTFQGEVWANKKGFMRILLRTLDRLISKLSTHLTVVSNGEKDFLIKEKIIDEKKSTVIANGSIGGVDLKRFRPNESSRVSMRKNLKFSKDEIVFLYMGRLNKDKGLTTLRDAFLGILQNQSHLNVKLLIVGPDEENIENLFEETIPRDFHSRVLFHPYTNRPEEFMNASDIFILPSLREGFGVVVIEAAAVGLPSICSDIYGLKDAFIKGKTGLQFKVNDSKGLQEQMLRLVVQKDEYNYLSENAQEYVKKSFDQKYVLNEFIRYYDKKIFLKTLLK